ncbi:MAG: hypothetical protein HQ592_01250 [Planctomycetes bacterium]|nr:hypothetical protein [Planctomycetota bacterium]
MTQTSTSLNPKIGVASLSSPLEIGADRASAGAEDLAGLLEGAGCEVLRLGPLDDPDKSVAAGRKLAESHAHAMAFAAVSWYEDYLALDLLEECSVPVLLWSLPGMETGALCGSQQLSAYLKQLGVPYQCVYGELDSADGLERAKAFLTAAALKKKMRRARIGLAGHRVVGMTEVSASEMNLKKAVGPRVITLDMPRLLARADEMPNEQARQTWQQLTSRSAACEVSEEEGLDSMRVYAAIKELVDRHRLDALTIGCYPHLMGRVCLAASLLADEGIPLGCEGDVNGAVGQLMLTLLTGEPTHNTDWLEPLEDGSVVFTHCGSGSFSLAENQSDITLASVRLMDQGVCALFTAKPGPVTLVSLLPLGDGYQCAVLEGEALSTQMVFPGNPLRVRFTQPTPQLIDWIHAEGIGHHWMAGYGHVAAEIRQWASIAGGPLRLVEP